MLRRFSRINSTPHYIVAAPADATDDQLPPPIIPHEEYQYLNLIHDIIEQNHEHDGRNGTTLAIFGAGMVFSLDQGFIPILTTKQMAWKTCL